MTKIRNQPQIARAEIGDLAGLEHILQKHNLSLSEVDGFLVIHKEHNGFQ
jgi:hypothetical protein